ncbi:MAG: hypothetical protein ACE5FJ_07305, partial [Gemmatimonadales bacterium]
VTVIATGFDREVGQDSPFGRSTPGVLPFPARQRSSGQVAQPSPAADQAAGKAPAEADISEMEIPTFIRRQMD